MNILNKEVLEPYIKTNNKSTLFPILAEIYFYENELEKAEKICNQGLKHHPDSPVGYYILGLLATEKDDIPKAILNFKFCIKKCPVFLKAYDKLLKIGKEFLSVQDMEFYYNQIKQIESDIKFPDIRETTPISAIKKTETDTTPTSSETKNKPDNVDILKKATGTDKQSLSNLTTNTEDEELVITENNTENSFLNINSDDQDNDDFSEQTDNFELNIESQDNDDFNIFDENLDLNNNEEPFFDNSTKQNQVINEFPENTNQKKEEPFLDAESSQQTDKSDIIIKHQVDNAFSTLNESDKKENEDSPTIVKPNITKSKPSTLSIQPVDDFEEEVSIPEVSEKVTSKPKQKIPPKSKNNNEEKIELKIPIPTMTFVEVLKKQALYDQALEILDMLEKRAHDKEKISQQKEEIYKLKAQDAIG